MTPIVFNKQNCKEIKVCSDDSTTPIDIIGADCLGAPVTVTGDKGTIIQTVPNPDTVQKVVICDTDTITSDVEYICNEATQLYDKVTHTWINGVAQPDVVAPTAYACTETIRTDVEFLCNETTGFFDRVERSYDSSGVFIPGSEIITPTTAICSVAPVAFDVTIQTGCLDTDTAVASTQATSTVQAFIPAENIVNVRIVECDTKLDPEVVCLVPNGSPASTTPITGVVVYDTTAGAGIAPTATYFIGNTDVTATHTQVPCDANLDYETKETCYQDSVNPNQKYTRVDWFEKDNLVTPVATVWFDVTAGTYSATAPSNIQPCSDVRQVLADHNNGCIERTVPQNVCSVTNSVFTLLDTDLTTFTITANDGNGNFTGVQDFSNPAVVPTFINMMTLLSSSGARTTEDIANGAVIFNFWEQNINNIVQTGPTQVQYDIHFEAGVTDTPTPLVAPCVDPVADSVYQSSAATLKSVFDGYVLGVPVPNGGSVVVFTVSVYSPAVTTTVTHIPAKQVVTYDVNGNPVSDLYYEQGTLTPIVFDPLTDVFKNVCTQQPINVDIVRCDNTVEQVQVKEIVGVYDLNKDYKHTERVYDNVTATLGGTITTITAGTNVLFDFTNVIDTNWVGANYLVDFGNGFTDIGGNPSFDYVNEPDGDYEIKVYRMFVYPEGTRFYLIGGVEVSLVSGSITVSSANPAPVNRSITYTQKEVFQDYCGQTPVGSPYLADGSVASVVGTLSTAYREEITEWQGVTDANNASTSQQLIAKSGILSIANGTFATNLGPDGTIWNNPGGLRSVTIRARRSNGTDAIPGSGANQVLIQTTDNKGVLLTNESVTFSVEDGNIQDFIYVDTLNNAAALIIYNRL